MKKYLIVLPLLGMVAAVAMVALSNPASADEACTGTIGAVTIDDNLEVPNGETCVLEGTTVQGNIHIEPNATLRASGVNVAGNIQTDDGGATLVRVVSGSHVDGDIQVFDSSAALANDVTVGGNIQYEGNDGQLDVISSQIDGDVQYFDNDGGTKTIRDNTIGENLQCSGNEPPPTGGNNEVGGDAEGQCERLGDGPPSPTTSTSSPSTTTTTLPDDDDDRFDDVDDDNVFQDEIEELAESGITVGCNPPDNNLFCPTDDVERQQMAAFLVRALDLPDGSTTFDDVDDDNVFADDISALADAGITLGCNPPENSQFCPTNDVERQEMAAFLVRALDLPDGSTTFDDVDDDNVFADDISALADAGITLGCNPPDNNLFCPTNNVERQQMAAFLVRAGLTD